MGRALLVPKKSYEISNDTKDSDGRCVCGKFASGERLQPGGQFKKGPEVQKRVIKVFSFMDTITARPVNPWCRSPGRIERIDGESASKLDVIYPLETPVICPKESCGVKRAIRRALYFVSSKTVGGSIWPLNSLPETGKTKEF
jgi:hypothetical protein